MSPVAHVAFVLSCTVVSTRSRKVVSVSELAAWGAGRYRRVGKRYERFDVAAADDGAIVYCLGTLHGERLDGTPFEGIRFIDRFTVRDGKLVDQLVWNDIAETWFAPAD